MTSVAYLYYKEGGSTRHARIGNNTLYYIFSQGNKGQSISPPSNYSCRKPMFQLKRTPKHTR